MKKNFITFCFCIIASTQSYSQAHHFNLSINLSENMLPQNLSGLYYNGKTFIPFTDTFTTRNIKLSGIYYSRQLYLEIFYKDNTFYVNDFLIDTLPATIALSIDTSKTSYLGYHNIRNANPVYDTSLNPMMKELSLYKDTSESAKEYGLFMDENLDRINKLDAQDSVYIKFLMMKRTKNLGELSIIKKHSNDYISFWYFQNSFLDPLLVRQNKNNSYVKQLIKELQDSMLVIFPEDLINSIEGQTILGRIKMFLNAYPDVGDNSPSFLFKDSFGKEVDFKQSQNKLILLDFWATWCIPCMQYIPNVKEIKKMFPEDKLTIIGINEDYDSTKFSNAANSYGMNWANIYDKDSYIANKFNVPVFPTLILIDKDGKILYKSYSAKDNNINNDNITELIKQKINSLTLK